MKMKKLLLALIFLGGCQFYQAPRYTSCPPSVIIQGHTTPLSHEEIDNILPELSKCEYFDTNFSTGKEWSESFSMSAMQER